MGVGRLQIHGGCKLSARKAEETWSTVKIFFFVLSENLPEFTQFLPNWGGLQPPVTPSPPLMQLQGGQQTLETLKDPEKPGIFFAPGKIPWKTLKLQHTPEKLCSEADFPHVNFWSYSTVAFLFL